MAQFLLTRENNFTYNPVKVASYDAIYNLGVEILVEDDPVSLTCEKNGAYCASDCSTLMVGSHTILKLLFTGVDE